MRLLLWLVIGALAGWFAGRIVKGSGFGLLGDIVVGIIGAFIGGWLFGALGIYIFSPIIGSLLSATVGAVILLLMIRAVRQI